MKHLIRVVFLGTWFVLSTCCLWGCSERASSDHLHLAQEALETKQQQARLAMVPVDFATWENHRRAAAPNILVVDIWATWCVPCLERFPHMVKLHEQYAAQGVTFVSLSVDDREDASSIEFANAFLVKQNARFDHYLLNEDILDGMNKLDIQGIPAVDIYARDGTLAYRLNGDDPNKQFSDTDVENAIKALLSAR